MKEFLLERKNYIAVYVIGYLMRGLIYHFFPPVNDILMWITILWPLILIGSDLYRRRFRMDRMKAALCIFLLAALTSTLLHIQAATPEVWVSLWNACGLILILFPAAETEEPKPYHRFFRRLFTAVFALISLMAAGSLFLYLCFRAGISLPGGLSGEEQLFTYGHLGEEKRFCGLFGYSTVGGNLCTIAVMTGIYLLEQNVLPKWLIMSCEAVLLAMVLLLDVRTSMVELFLVGVFLVWITLRKRMPAKRVFLLFSAAAVIAAAGVWILKQNAIMSFLANMKTDPVGTMRFLTTGRSVYWTQAWEGFLKHPILGQGWNNNTGVKYFDSHNLLFNLLLWTGLTGTIAFFTFLGLLVQRMWKDRSRIEAQKLIGLVCVVIGVFAASMLERTLIGTENTTVDTSCFWLAAGMLGYGIRHGSESEQKPEA